MLQENYPATTWRLIKTPPAPGAWNMAVDEAVLETVGNHQALPTLRLFAWDPPCLSLGYAQPFSDVDHANLIKHGWDVVRRVTGGRAILHTDELTYSVAAPHEELRLEGNVLESYRRISSALLTALELMGVPAEALPKPPSNTSSKQPAAVCFEVPSNYEITILGKKLIGSAQARKKAGILQHGTLPLFGDLTRITQALAFPNETSRTQAAERLLNRATTIEMALGHSIPWDQSAIAFSDAFAQVLNLSLEESQLTPGELARAEELVKEKYAHPSWTERI